MSVPVLFAVVLQLLLAVCFVIMLVAYRRVGPRAQAAAEVVAGRQGVSPELLARSGISLMEGIGGFVVGYAIAVVLTVLAGLNLAGVGLGRTLSWIVEPLILVAVGYVTTVQVFAVPITVRSLAKASDARVRELDVGAVLAAAVAELPGWYRPITVFRWLLATVGSVLVIVLLAVPGAAAWFSG